MSVNRISLLYSRTVLRYRATAINCGKRRMGPDCTSKIKIGHIKTSSACQHGRNSRQIQLNVCRLACGAGNVCASVNCTKSGNILAPETLRLMTLTSLLSSDGTEVRNTSSTVCNDEIDILHRRLYDGQGKLYPARTGAD